MKYDTALLIEVYLKGKQIDDSDSFGIIDEQLVSWNFKHIPQPTMEELQALAPVVEEAITQAEINAEARAFLVSTDWYILRELEGIPCPEGIKLLRQKARDSISE